MDNLEFADNFPANDMDHCDLPVGDLSKLEHMSTRLDTGSSSKLKHSVHSCRQSVRKYIGWVQRDICKQVRWILWISIQHHIELQGLHKYVNTLIFFIYLCSFGHIKCDCDFKLFSICVSIHRYIIYVITVDP
jgi:hypothetical protein